ncbi:MAG: 50S ribosomal protein L4, partial [Phycisphaerales bacterium]|nr:50S ribosomal protein L4 [Phycisphaerales bacterium]
RLLKQAIVAFLDHQRQDSARTKGKAQVAGSTRKLYRQKGTGNARMGQIRQPVRRGGGRAFAKRGPRSTRELPKKMRRLARDSAILAKIKAQEVMVVDGFHCEAPRTKTFAAMLSALSARHGCVFALHAYDSKAYLSARNIPNTEIKVVDELGAYEILRRRTLILTRPAFERVAGGFAAVAQVSA